MLFSLDHNVGNHDAATGYAVPQSKSTEDLPQRLVQRHPFELGGNRSTGVHVSLLEAVPIELDGNLVLRRQELRELFERDDLDIDIGLRIQDRPQFRLDRPWGDRHPFRGLDQA